MKVRHAMLGWMMVLASLGGGCGRPAVEHAARSEPARLDSGRISGERALEEARMFVELGPKIPGTVEMVGIADYLKNRLIQVGAEADIQEFVDQTPEGEKRFRNVLGRIPGRGASTRLLLLAAHYDTKTGIEPFEGANDSASGTGLILELARVLAESGPHAMEIRFALFDGEESLVAYGPHDGFHGSRHLAVDMAEGGELQRLAAMILLDMVGDRELTITIPRNGTPWLIALAFEAAREEGVRRHFGLFDGGIGDDHMPFLDRGAPAVDLIDFRYGGAPGKNDYWHTPEDTMDKISAESLETVGRVTLRMVDHLLEEAR
ncbi:MAG: M28 family peptidase [Verrucomicrobiota bacterium]|jgi:glutaminyl-peptide cyclotransferase|nr:M28 family peptidase [Verrucomicrobiota bacterium]